MEDNGYRYIHKLSEFVTSLDSRKKLLERLDTKKMSRIPSSCPFCTANHYEKLRNPSVTLETVSASAGMTYTSGRVISHS